MIAHSNVGRLRGLFYSFHLYYFFPYYFILFICIYLMEKTTEYGKGENMLNIYYIHIE